MDELEINIKASELLVIKELVCLVFEFYEQLPEEMQERFEQWQAEVKKK